MTMSLFFQWRWALSGSKNVTSIHQWKKLRWKHLQSLQGSATLSRLVRREVATNNGGSNGANDSTPGLQCGFSRLLTDEQRALFHQVNQLLLLSKSLAKQVGNVAVKEDSFLADIARLQSELRQRQQPSRTSSEEQQPIDNITTPLSLFTVVFAGEFNSGKSTLINALLGCQLLETGVLPTTNIITILYADNDLTDSKDEINTIDSVNNAHSTEHTHLQHLSAAKFPILSDLCLVDTPGTNAILSLKHTNLTLRILHDADLIIFVTSADRPFSESEKNLIRTSIKSYRKRVVVVINKMDILERQKGEDHGDMTKMRVVDYVIEHASDLLGTRPVVIPLSARDALSTKLLYSSHGNRNEIHGQDTKSSLWNRSNLEALEQFLLKELTASSKVKTKLLNPIGVSEGILAECRKEIKRREEELEVDIMTLRLLKSQTDAWERDLKREIIDKYCLDVREAVQDRAETAMRIVDELSYIEQWKLGFGLGKKPLHQILERTTHQNRSTLDSKSWIRGSNHSLEDSLCHIVGECSSNLISRANKQGLDSLEYLGKRPAMLGSFSEGKNGTRRMVGNVRTPKFRRLDELEMSMKDMIQKSIRHFPSDKELSSQVYKLLNRTAMVSTLFVVSGFATTALSAWEVIPLHFFGTILTALGVTLIPVGNRLLASSLKQQLMQKASQLEISLDILLKDACHHIRLELSESVSSYTRYVDSESEGLKELLNSTDTAIISSRSLRGNINKMCQ